MADYLPNIENLVGILNNMVEVTEVVRWDLGADNVVVVAVSERLVGSRKPVARDRV